MPNKNPMTLEVAQYLTWGTYGLAESGSLWETGPNPLEYKKLGDLDSDHLRNILATQRLADRGISSYVLAINLILEDRDN